MSRGISDHEKRYWAVMTLPLRTLAAQVRRELGSDFFCRCLYSYVCEYILTQETF